MNPLVELARHRLRNQVERLERSSFSAALAVDFASAVLEVDTKVLDCNICQAALPQHIEAELNHRPSQECRRIRHHIDLCPTCSEVYLDLLEVALLTEEGPLPAPALAIDLSFLEPPSRRKSNA